MVEDKQSTDCTALAVALLVVFKRKTAINSTVALVCIDLLIVAVRTNDFLPFLGIQLDYFRAL